MGKDIAVTSFDKPWHYDQWWDFLEQPESYVVPLETLTAGANANDDVAATLVGVIPAAAVLLGGYVVASANSAGIDANNTSTFAVTIGGTAALSLAHAANLVADTAVSLGTPSTRDVAAGAAVKASITTVGTADLNSAVVHIGLQLADAKNYPATGLKAVASDGGSCTISDGVKGVLVMNPGASDNDEIYVAAATETIKFASGKSFIMEALIQFTEANTDDANVIFGCMNAVAADALIDDGGGPRATGDYVAMWKVDGGTKWYAGVQSNNTQTPTVDTVSEVTAGGSAYQRLWIKVTCESSTRAVAEFCVDGTIIATLHFAYTSATEMQMFVGVKNGGANAQALNVDYMGYAQLR